MSALLALVPFRDWFYAAIIAAVGLFAWHTYHKYEVAVAYAATVKAESAKTQADARAAIQAADAYYETTLKTLTEKQNADLQAAAASSADLAGRLRKYQNAHCPNTVLGSAAPATPAGASGASSVDEAVSGVISAAAHDNAIVLAERAERDSLTGK